MFDSMVPGVEEPSDLYNMTMMAQNLAYGSASLIVGKPGKNFVQFAPMDHCEHEEPDLSPECPDTEFHFEQLVDTICSDADMLDNVRVVFEDEAICQKVLETPPSIATTPAPDAASVVVVASRRRRSPLMEVVIDADNYGFKRETVLAGHVHIEEDEDDTVSEVSGDDDSECQFLLDDTGDDLFADLDVDEFSIGAFCDLLSGVQIELLATTTTDDNKDDDDDNVNDEED